VNTHRPLAVVTGASSGIGRALAAELVEHGYDVVAAAEDDAVHVTAEELSGLGCEVRAVQVDLSTREGCERLHDEVAGTRRPVAVLVLNAGVAVGGEDLVHTPLEDHLRLVDLNCRSTVHLAHRFVREMVTEGEGRVLVTSSVAAFAPGPYQTTYAASKAFGHLFAEGLRHELQGTGVTVTSLLPGPTDTEIFSRGGLGGTGIAEGRKDDPADVARRAYQGMVEGRANVVTASLPMKAQVAASGLIPDRLAAAVAARQTRPGSGRQ